MKMGILAVQNLHKSQQGRGEETKEPSVCAGRPELSPPLPFSPPARLANTASCNPFCFFYGWYVWCRGACLCWPMHVHVEVRALLFSETRPLTDWSRLAGWRASDLPVSASLPQSWVYRLAAMPASYMAVACYMHII